MVTATFNNARDFSSLPERMRAVAVERFGPPSVLTVHELPVPKPRSHEVLIRLDTAGVGSWDASIREGKWKKPGPSHFPLVPGVDGSGTVVATGSHVRRFRPGDKVYGYEFGNRQGGFYAEYAVADADHVARVPGKIDLEKAGVVATTGLTALQGIDALRLRAGETVLIFGASGAVGTMAVQFAAQHKVRVFATATGKAAARLVRSLGASAIIDARDEEFIKRLRKAAPTGIDAVFALAGGEELERCLDFVRPGGRVVHPNGVEPEPRSRKDLRIKSFDAVAEPRAFAKLNQTLLKKRVRVPIAAVYPLGKAAQAHRRLHSDHVIGRMALRIGGRV
ncbi:MAG TPA: NADP-dependent oxidoreductase [Rhizomicrobium sp.]